jgi:cyclopropane fatty-acyl-phospholipid synthase-like methyltransferase
VRQEEDVVRALTTIALLAAAVQCAPALRAQDHAQAGHAPGHMEHSFADAERYARSFDDPARDAWQMPDRVVSTLGVKAGQSVADIGAGTGYFSVRLARTPAAPKVFAVDIEPNMVGYLRARAQREGLPNIVPVLADANGSNLPEPVDAVLIVDTYHHIPNRVEYFTALKARMKPGATLAIIDFRKDAPGDGPPPEFRFTPDQITGELSRAGFTLRSTHDFLPRQMFLIYTPDQAGR